MKNKPQEIIEASRWLFPAMLFSRWLWPLAMIINLISEVLGIW